MKTKIYIIVTFLALGMYVKSQMWEYVCSLTDEQLCKVYAQGTDTVYVVGENGLIAKSTDKGLTWNRKYFPNKETLNDIIFCNHEVGFIVGNNGTILRTQDASSSWEQMTSGTVLDINAIVAFDLNNIWTIGSTWDTHAMRYRNLIMHSTDMGETWNAKPLLPDNLYLSDIKCKGSRGYITGDEGIVLKTEDGGMTWEEQVLTEYYGIRSLSITDNKVYALGDDNIIFTEDNVNWYILNTTLNPYEKLNVYFQDDQKGFISSYAIPTCGGCGPTPLWIEKTTDGGNTWEHIYDDYFTLNNHYDRSNFAFSSNNEFGYCVLRGHLVRMPYTGEFQYCYSEIDVIKSKNQVQILNQQENELQVNSDLKMISRVEIITIDGRKIMKKTEQANTININVNNLPKGIYLVNVLFSDKTNYFSKWIKNSK